DYVGGSNHVLPTARSARFSSGLGVLDFMKRTSILKCGPEQHAALGPYAIALGEAEGLDAPAPSVALRLDPRCRPPRITTPAVRRRRRENTSQSPAKAASSPSLWMAARWGASAVASPANARSRSKI